MVCAVWLLGLALLAESRAAGRFDREDGELWLLLGLMDRKMRVAMAELAGRGSTARWGAGIGKHGGRVGPVQKDEERGDKGQRRRA